MSSRFKMRPELILDEALVSLDPSILWDQPTGHNDRIARILQHWEEGRPMDPPRVHVDFDDDYLVHISDGRHRLLVSYHLDQTEVPVAVPCWNVDDFKTHFDLVKADPAHGR